MHAYHIFLWCHVLQYPPYKKKHGNFGRTGTTKNHGECQIELDTKLWNILLHQYLRGTYIPVLNNVLRGVRGSVRRSPVRQSCCIFSSEKLINMIYDIFGGGDIYTIFNNVLIHSPIMFCFHGWNWCMCMILMLTPITILAPPHPSLSYAVLDQNTEHTFWSLAVLIRAFNSAAGPHLKENSNPPNQRVAGFFCFGQTRIICFKPCVRQGNIYAAGEFKNI